MFKYTTWSITQLVIQVEQEDDSRWQRHSSHTWKSKSNPHSFNIFSATSDLSIFAEKQWWLFQRMCLCHAYPFLALIKWFPWNDFHWLFFHSDPWLGPNQHFTHPLASFDILAAHFVWKPIVFKALDRHWGRCWWQEVSSKGTEAL